MANSLDLRERVLRDMKIKQQYKKTPEQVIENCNIAFEELSKIKINHSEAKKLLNVLRGK